MAGWRRSFEGRNARRGDRAASTSRATRHASRREVASSLVATTLAFVLGGSPKRALADAECSSCSDSNSSLQPGDKAFRTTSSGLRVLDVREGKGASPQKGSLVVLDWSGYTSGYQAKRIDNTQNTDNQFVFRLGSGEAIPAFEEAVEGMRVGGVRRIEIPGELEERLAYPVDKSMRYAAGPKPFTLGGKRALDFVLDNKTLKSFNKTLLFDIRLNSIREG